MFFSFVCVLLDLNLQLEGIYEAEADGEIV